MTIDSEESNALCAFTLCFSLQVNDIILHLSPFHTYTVSNTDEHGTEHGLNWVPTRWSTRMNKVLTRRLPNKTAVSTRKEIMNTEPTGVLHGLYKEKHGLNWGIAESVRCHARGNNSKFYQSSGSAFTHSRNEHGSTRFIAPCSSVLDPC